MCEFMRLPCEGIIVALWTPTDTAGHVDESGLRSNIEFLKDKNLSGFMLMGSTGEFARLDLKERLRLLELVRPLTSHLPSMVNVSAMRPSEVTLLGKRARELGFESVSLMTPWFYPLAQPDLVEFFVNCASAIDLPLFLYNFPERTGIRIGLRTIAAVADRVTLAGVKQSGDEFDYHRELVVLGREKRFAVLSGGEIRLTEAVALGASGCVSGLANAAPELVVSLFHAAVDGDNAQADTARRRIQELLRVAGKLEFPMNVAAAMTARGLAAGQPKTPLSTSTEAGFRLVVDELRQCYKTWGLT